MTRLRQTVALTQNIRKSGFSACICEKKKVWEEIIIKAIHSDNLPACDLIKDRRDKKPKAPKETKLNTISRLIQQINFCGENSLNTTYHGSR